MRASRLLRWWNDLSVSKKVYGIVGIMTLLIAFELFSMLFATSILSSVRSFGTGESLWSKAQKNAILNLYRYAEDGNPSHYVEFQENLKIPMGDRQARLELQKSEPDLDVARAGFLQGKNHPHDIDGLIRLIRRFGFVSYVKNALAIWQDADNEIDNLIAVGALLDRALKAKDLQAVRANVFKIDQLNREITIHEDQFAAVLGEGSRWLESVMRYLLLFAVLVVELTGLWLTIGFARKLSRNIRGMSRIAHRVGSGDFTQSIAVESKDEIGKLAGDINKMTTDLQNSIGKREHAENANQLKSLFLANMSHEIRTPLGVILGLAEALKQPNLSQEDQQKYVRTIERTGGELKQIINDILDISKVESGRINIEKNTFNLPQLLEELKNEWEWRAKSDGNKLEFRADGKVPTHICTDRIRLRQILANLIGNALKFTQNGSVTVTYSFRSNKLLLRVKDTGIGISPEQKNRLFQPFSQLDSSSTRRFGGTGLGLFLSRRLAELLGGTIELEESRVGSGSTFLATIKIDASMEIPLKEFAEKFPTSEADLTGKRVLIVDDSVDNQMLLQFFMNKWGIKWESATNGKEGVEKAQGKDFDVVLMDIQMPVMDGYEAASVLRQSGYAKPIIALTAHAMKEDRERSLDAGCTDYLTKPVDFNQLNSTLRNLLAT